MTQFIQTTLPRACRHGDWRSLGARIAARVSTSVAALSLLTLTSSAANLLQNPGYEDSPAGIYWSNAIRGGVSQVITDPALAHSGNNCVSNYNSGGWSSTEQGGVPGTAWYTGATLPISGANFYQLSAWVKVPGASASPRQITLRYRWYPSGNRVDVGTQTINTEDWTQVVSPWIQPAGGDTAVEYFEVHSLDNAVIFFADDCALAETNAVSLTGQVVDGSAVGVDGATVTVTAPYFTASATAAGGYYTFTVPAGNYTVTASKYLWTSASQGVTATGIAVTAPNLVITPLPLLTVSGTVRQSDTTPVEASVYVTCVNGTVNVGPVVATGGSFSIPNVPQSSSYVVTASKPGFTPNPAVVTSASATSIAVVMNPDPGFNTNLVFSLNATNLAAGNITNPIVNIGEPGGYWVSEGGNPVVGPIAGLPAVTFNSGPRLFLTSDFVNQQNAPSYMISPSPSVQYTVAGLLYRQASGGGEAYFSWSPYQHGTCFQFIGGNNTAVDNWTAGGYINYSPLPSRGEWQYVVVTEDGTTCRLYVDGVPQGAQNTGFACDNLAGNYPVRIGCGQQAADFGTYSTVNPIRNFGGSINSLAVYRSALDIATVSNTWVSMSQPITATAGANGAISPSGTVRVVKGASKTFTFTPALGYKINQVLVDGIENPAAATAGNFTFASVTTSHTISVTFAQLPPQNVSGTVTNASGGGIANATVFFSTSPNASVAPVYKANTDGSGNYTQPLYGGTWYACAAADSYLPSADITFTVTTTPLTGKNIDLVPSGRLVPQQGNLLVAALSSALTNAAAPWPVFMPKGAAAMTAIGAPGVSTIGGVTAENNPAEGAGYRFYQGVYNPPNNSVIPMNGGTIVAVCQPELSLSANSYQNLVSVFLNQFSICVDRSSGAVSVGVQAGAFGPNLATGVTLTSGQPYILSLVVQSGGGGTLYVNGAPAWSGPTPALTSISPQAWFNVDINVGKGWEGDGWSSFIGNIGDVFVYSSALPTADRHALEAGLGATFGIPIPNIPFTGKVTLPDGVTPVAGATITAAGLLSTQTGTSAGDGTFSFLVISNENYTVSAAKSGYSQTSASFSGVVTSPTVYNFTMSRIDTITGTVRNTNGQPIYNAVVQVGAGGPAAVTGTNGTYQMVLSSFGPGVSFYADALGYGDHAEDIDTTPASGGVMTKNVTLTPKNESDYSYIQNGGFETGTLAPWFQMAPDANIPPIIGVTNTSPASGNYCAYWKSTGNGWYVGWLAQYLPVVPGSTYNIYYKIKSAAAIGQCGFSVCSANFDEQAWWGYAGGLNPGANWMFQNTQPGIWQQVLDYRTWDDSQHLVAARVDPSAFYAGAPYLRLIMSLGADAAGEMLYVDDVVVDRVGPAAPPLKPVIGMVGGEPNFTFGTISGQNYRMVYKNSLTDLSWLSVSGTNWTAGTGATVTLTDTNAPLPSTRFYKIEMEYQAQTQ